MVNLSFQIVNVRGIKLVCRDRDEKKSLSPWLVSGETRAENYKRLEGRQYCVHEWKIVAS